MPPPSAHHGRASPAAGWRERNSAEKVRMMLVPQAATARAAHARVFHRPITAASPASAAVAASSPVGHQRGVSSTRASAQIARSAQPTAYHAMKTASTVSPSVRRIEFPFLSARWLLCAWQVPPIGCRRRSNGARLAALWLLISGELLIQHITWIVGAALLVATAACEGIGAPARVTVPADSAAGEVPFRLAGPGGAAIVVPVYINGVGPTDLVLDTGATLTCVDNELAQKLALPERLGAVGVGASVSGTGRLRLLRIDSIRVGGARAEGLTACAVDLQALRAISPNVHGLLGLNFLKNFRVTLDFQRDVLALAAP